MTTEATREIEGGSVDPRMPRFGQAITGTAVLLGFVLDVPQVLPAIAIVLAAASLGGPRASVYAYLYRALARGLSLGAPSDLEEAAPPRFANTVGFVFLAVATAAYALGAEVAAWILGLIVSALALLAAATGFCVGCEFYLLARRITRRRSSERGRMGSEAG